MSNWTIFILIGLILEIAGAFILAADAIGLKRFAQWINFLLSTKEQLTGKQKVKDSIFKPSSGRITVAIICMLGSGVGYWVANKVQWINKPEIVAGIVGAIMGIIVLIIIIFILKIIIVTLHSIEIKTRKQTIGLIGFSFLLFGFIFQFIGTLIDMIYKH